MAMDRELTSALSAARTSKPLRRGIFRSSKMSAGRGGGLAVAADVVDGLLAVADHVELDGDDRLREGFGDHDHIAGIVLGEQDYSGLAGLAGHAWRPVVVAGAVTR